MKRVRTPIAIVRGAGSARSGTHEFILVRLTSLALVILLVAFVVVMVALVGAPRERVLEVLASPLVAMVMVAGILLTTVHMRVGMQVIIEDYVHAELPKLALLALNWLFAWGVALVALFAVLKITFGAA